MLTACCVGLDLSAGLWSCLVDCFLGFDLVSWVLVIVGCFRVLAIAVGWFGRVSVVAFVVLI